MAREYRGGYYKMDHDSFGQMMVSEQLRPALVTISGLIKTQARVNTQRSGGSIAQGRDDGDKSLADSYEVERGPIVIIKGQGGLPGPRITQRVVNRLRHAAVNEFGRGGWKKGKGTRDLRRAGEMFGDLAGEAG